MIAFDTHQCENILGSYRNDPLAPWSAPTLAPYLSQSISIALQRSVADQILKLAADARAAPFRA